MIFFHSLTLTLPGRVYFPGHIDVPVLGANDQLTASETLEVGDIVGRTKIVIHVGDELQKMNFFQIVQIITHSDD